MNVLPEWVEWVKAIGPVILGVITVFATVFSLWVAYRQSKISQQQSRISAEQARVAAEKLRFDLYEKRLAAYAQFRSLIQHVKTVTIPDANELHKIYDSIREHQWLFGPEVASKLDELFLSAYEIHCHETRMKAATDTEPHSDRAHVLVTRFDEQLTTVDTLFEPYLRFDKQIA